MSKPDTSGTLGDQASAVRAGLTPDHVALIDVPAEILPQLRKVAAREFHGACQAVSAGDEYLERRDQVERALAAVDAMDVSPAPADLVRWLADEYVAWEADDDEYNGGPATIEEADARIAHCERLKVVLELRALAAEAAA